MKQFILLIVVLSFVAKTYAQTNMFPTTVNVGIGTTAPQTKLQVTGGGLSVTRANTQTGINGFKKIYSDNNIYVNKSGVGERGVIS